MTSILSRSLRRGGASILSGFLAILISVNGLTVRAQSQSPSFYVEQSKFVQSLKANSPQEIVAALEERFAASETAEADALYAVALVASMSPENLNFQVMEKTLATIENRFPKSWSVRSAVAEAYSVRSTRLSAIGASKASKGEAAVARARAIQKVDAALRLAAEDSDPNDSFNGALPDYAPFRTLKSVMRLYLTILLPSVTNSPAADYVKLQALTPLDENATIEPNLYDYESEAGLAPLGKDGKPLFFAVPQSLESAKSDGERYMLLSSNYWKTSYPAEQLRYRYEWAEIVNRLFGASLHKDIERYRRDSKATSVPETVKSLKDDETVLHVNNDAKDPNEFVKVKLSNEYNYFAIWKDLFAKSVENAGGDETLLAARFDPRQMNSQTPLWSALATEYQIRGRNDLARETYQKRLDDCAYIQEYQPRDISAFNRVRSIASDDARKIEQILLSLATPIANIVGLKQESYPGAIEVSSQYVSKLCFKLYRLNANYVLDQMKDPAFLAKYYKKPKPSFCDMLDACASDDFEKTGAVRHVGTPDTFKFWTLKSTKNRKTIVDVVSEWSVDIKVDPHGQFQTTFVDLPQIAPGNYFITLETPSSAERGKFELLTTATLQLPRTLIVRKMFDDGFRFYFLDSKTGAPRADVDAAICSVQTQAEERRVTFKSETFRKKSDETGAVLLPFEKEEGASRYGSVLVAALEDSVSVLDFSTLAQPWEVRSFDDPDATFCGNTTVKPSERFENTIATITFDRPVAREGDSVQFVFHADKTSYDSPRDAVSPYANAELHLQIAVYNTLVSSPNLVSRKVKLDESGSYVGSFVVKKGVLAGMCRFTAKLNGVPVVVDAPSGNLRLLGRETFPDLSSLVLKAPEATATRDSGFAIDALATETDGAPLQNAPFEYQITARQTNPQAYPTQPLDWLYGKGYGRFYPGSAAILGDDAPLPFVDGALKPAADTQSVEIAKGEAVTDADGQFQIYVDPKNELQNLAGDLVYTVSVQRKPLPALTQSRRKIYITKVRAAQAAFRVDVSRDKGFYNADEQPKIAVSVRAVAPNLTPESATLTLESIAPNPEGSPKASLVETLDVALQNGQGEATLKALPPGQYKLSVAANSESAQAKSASLFVVRGGDDPERPLVADPLELTPEKSEYAPGETATIQILSANQNAVVEVHPRSFCGELSGKPIFVQLKNGVGYVDLPVSEKDVPNVFVAASTVVDGAYASRLVELLVPPYERFLNVETGFTVDNAARKVKAKARVLDSNGKPVKARLLVSAYDSRLNPREDDAMPDDVRKTYWKWSRFSELLEHASATLTTSPEIRLQRIKEWNAAHGQTPPTIRRQYEMIEVDSFLRSRGEVSAYETNLLSDSQKTRTLDPAANLSPIFWAPSLATNDAGEVEFEFVVPQEVPSASVRIIALGKGETVGLDLSELTIK